MVAEGEQDIFRPEQRNGFSCLSLCNSLIRNKRFHHTRPAFLARNSAASSMRTISASKGLTHSVTAVRMHKAKSSNVDQQAEEKTKAVEKQTRRNTVTLMYAHAGTGFIPVQPSNRRREMLKTDIDQACPPVVRPVLVHRFQATGLTPPGNPQHTSRNSILQPKHTRYPSLLQYRHAPLTMLRSLEGSTALGH